MRPPRRVLRGVSGTYALILQARVAGDLKASQDFRNMTFDLLFLCMVHININGLGGATLRKKVLQQSPSLWKAVYEHRNVLDTQILEEHNLDDEKDIFEVGVVSVFVQYHQIYEKVLRSIDETLLFYV